MDIIGFIGIFIAIVTVIFLSIKGLHIIVAAPIATLIVLLTNQMPVLEWMFGPEQSYMVELASFLISMFGLFVLGSILTQFMEKSGATRAISKQIIDWIGTENPFLAMVAVVLIGALLTYGGVNAFIVFFAILPISRSIFKELDLNWSLITIPLFTGIATFTMTMLPGTPSPTNVVPVNYLGTSLTTGPLLGIGASITTLIFCLLFMRFRLNQSLKKGETFYTYRKNVSGIEEDMALEEENIEDFGELPGFIISILPLITLILLILFFSHVNYIVMVGLSAAALVAMIFYRKYIKDDYIKLLNDGATSAIAPAVSTASAVAFGSLLIYADGFDVIVDLIGNISTNPMVLMIFIASILGGVTGSTTGAVAIVMNTMSQELLATGIAPAVIHRISVVATGLFVQMPHAGSYITFKNLSGLSIKDTYKDAFITLFGGHLVGLITMIILSYLFY